MRTFVTFMLALVLFLGAQQFLYAYSYGPACQWIRLRGEVKFPEGRAVKKPIQLTVTYQLPNMKNQATLLTGYPLQRDQFKFFLAGFNEKLGNAILVSPMFFFAKKIVFRYYAQSADGKWQSAWSQSTFMPPHVPILDIPKNKNKEFLCHSEIHLDPLDLKSQY